MMKPCAAVIIAACAATGICSAAECDTIAARSPAQIVAAGAGSLAVNAAVTEVLKHSVHEMRPDRTADNSFPSRHTSWAFTASGVISRELYMHSPWWSFGAQAMASAVAYQRVAARRHYASDVIAGAAVGIASAELTYLLVDRLSGRRRPCGADADFRPSLAMSSGAVYNFSRHFCTGFSTALNLRVPLHDRWGMAAVLTSAVTPVKTVRQGVRPLNTISFGLGIVRHVPLPCSSLALEPSLTVGAMRDIGRHGTPDGYGFALAAGTGLQWRLTRAFGCRADAAYQLTGTRNSIVLSVSSVSYF